MTTQSITELLATIQHLCWIFVFIAAVAVVNDKSKPKKIRAIMTALATAAAYMAGW